MSCTVCGGAFALWLLQGMGFDLPALLARAALILHDPQYGFTAGERLRTLAGQARSAGHAAVLCGLETAYVEEQFRPYDRVFKRFYTKVEYVPHLEDVTARVDKFTIYFPEGDAQKGYDALYGPVWGGRFSVAVAGADWVDIMNPGIHKGAALLLLGERLGVPPEGMMAFGDTFNDAEMLKAAKYGFLVENGSPALREEVPFLAPPNTSSGVMQVLRRVLAQNGRVCESDFRRAK